MLELIVQGIGFGFAAGSAPGPLQSFLISTTLGGGWRRGIIVIFTPLVIDLPIIMLTVFLLNDLPDLFIRGMQIAGGLFVLWLAYNGWKGLRAGQRIGQGVEESTETNRRILMQSATMNLLSPGPYIFWGTVTGPVLVEGLKISVLHGLAFVIAFYGTFLGFLAGLVLIFDRLRLMDERITRIIQWGTIIVLALLGFGLIRQGLTG